MSIDLQTPSDAVAEGSALRRAGRRWWHGQGAGVRATSIAAAGTMFLVGTAMPNTSSDPFSDRGVALEIDGLSSQREALAGEVSSLEQQLREALAAADREASTVARLESKLATRDATIVRLREELQQAKSTATSPESSPAIDGFASSSPAGSSSSASSSSSSSSSAGTSTATRKATVIDGDTIDVGGVRIRVGLVNTPEKGEGCFDEATRFTSSFVSGGVTYDAYATDSYGRTVAEVFDDQGRSLNVAIAGSKLSDDRYYDQFAHENPDLARRVRAAYVAPRSDCFSGSTTTAAPQNASSSCHPDYVTCIPIKGDGSGSPTSNDLDCGDIRKKVQLRKIGVDPYRLDGSDNDGWGCESYG